MRKVYSLLLVVVLLVLMTAPAYAAETRDSYLGEDIVIWICVSKQGGSSYQSLNGHAWLIVENRSTVDIAIGGTFILAGDIVTVGGWRDANSTTGTAYVNEEVGSNYWDAVALKVYLSPYHLYYLRDAINSASDKLYYPDGSVGHTDLTNAYTCVNFALEVWHEVGGTTLNVTEAPKTAEALWNLIVAHQEYTFDEFDHLMSGSKPVTEI